MDKFCELTVAGPLLDALKDAPALKCISMSEPDLDLYIHDHDVFKSPSLSIVCRNAPDPFAGILGLVERAIPEEVKSRVVHVETNESNARKAAYVIFQS